MPRESKANMKRRVGAIIKALRKQYPDARTALEFSSPLELLVATVLSAQTTDKHVNAVTKDLFRKYRTAAHYAAATQEQLQQDIRSIGFFRNKSRNIRAAAKLIVEEFGGEGPDTMEGLLKLPGVARKTANVVLGSAFGRDEGIVVDTHVIRLSQRLGLTRRKNNQGDKIEKELIPLVPQKQWGLFGHLLVHHGRAVCTARKPDCDGCTISASCPSAGKV